MPDERPRAKQHSRGISHDSGTQDDEDSAGGGGFRASPMHEMTQGFGAYFRRLSIMPASVRVSLSSIKVVEAARGILFALSQIHQAAQQYVGLCGDAALSRNINRVLYNAKTHVGNLIDSLEAHEGKGEGADVLPVIEGCHACVGAFKHVINILLQHIELLADRADVRLTRTFILLIYGAAVEMQNSWAGLRPSLPLGETRPTLPSPIPNTPGGNIAKTSSPQANRLKTIIGAPPNITLPPTPTSTVKPDLPKLPPEFQPPPTPSGDVDTDEPIFEKIQTATTTALGVLAHISEEVAKLHVPGSIPAGKELPSATMAKLKELGAYAVSTGDVTKRLKGRVALVKDRREFVERRKFWEDTNTFVKVIPQHLPFRPSLLTPFRR
jgi:RAM signalling pathway protein